MAQLLGSEPTTFTLDNMGRDFCNTLQEALDSLTVAVSGNQRGFDVIVVGGGTFGATVAEGLFVRDATRSRRILVLEAGPFVLPEHVQNMPFIGGLPNFRRPWVYDPRLEPFFAFPGLCFTPGGRSLAWGGWSPELLHDAKNDEMTGWPAATVNDLKARYFAQASDEIGVTATNDFIHGPLHAALRRQLLDGLTAASTPGGLILDDLPDHPIIRDFLAKNPGKTAADIPDAQLRDWLNLPATDTTPRAALLRLLKLEAPLAVQSVTEPGFFPFNKFSPLPLLIRAARTASGEADGVGPEADARKRLLVVPDCHVQELITQTQGDGFVRVVGVRVLDHKDRGASVDVPLAPPRPDGKQSVVVIALGTIESTRLALTTFQTSLASRAAQRMGQNFIAHLRSNLNIRVPLASLTTALSPAE